VKAINVGNANSSEGHGVGVGNVESKESAKNQHNLEASELRYRRLFETAQDGVLLIDFYSGMIKDVNPFLIEMLGYSKENFLKKHLWEVGVFKDIAASKDNFKTLQEKRFVRFEDLPLQTKTGKKINVEFVANAYKVDGETIIQCNVRDITERRKAETLLEESENRFRQIFENGHFGIVLTNENFKFIRANPSFCRMLGYTEKELLSKKFADITHPDNVNEDIENVKLLFAGKRSVYRTEKRYIRKDGGVVWGNVVVSVVRNADKSFLYFLAMIENITKRKLTEHLLIEGNQMLNQAVETIPSRIFWKDRNLNYLGSNTLFARDAGKRSPEDIVGHTDYEMGWAKQAELYRKDDAKVISSGKAKIKYEEPQTTPDGKTIWLETSKIPLRNSEGQVMGILGTYTDITERKKIEEDLRKSEDKFSKIFESSPYALAITRIKDGKFLDVNKAFTALSGISREEALSDSSVGLGVWSNVKDRDMMIDQLKAKGFIESREFPFRTRDRGVVYGLYSARLIELNNEPYILSSIADLTEIKRAEQQVIELKNRNDAILTSIGDAVFAVDQDGKVLLFNEAAEKLTGIPAKKVIGKKYYKVISFLTENEEKPVGDFVSEVIKRNKIIKNLNHTLIITKSGIKIPVANSVAPIRKETGDVVGCVVSFRDISTEREIDRAKTEFVSLASHQLRTPLTAINWYSEMLISEDNGKLNTKQKEYTNETYKASKRMISLINALLNVSRLETGNFVIEPTPLDLVENAKSCISELQSQISKNRIEFTGNYDSNLDKVKADPKLTSIIFQNLLSNAIKYTEPGGKVSLTIGKDQNAILIKVADTGVGVPKYQQDKLFTKLFRADNARNIDPDGTGLGLYIVKSIVDGSGGKVWFESNPGKGSTFSVSLPLTGMEPKRGTKKLI